MPKEGVSVIFTFEPYEIDIDIRKTTSFYESADLVSEGCSCDGSLLYGGFYHICGTLLRGKSAWVKIDEHTCSWKRISHCRLYSLKSLPTFPGC